jgi:hypothetical protein
MENLTLSQTNETPEINFQIDGHLLIKGVSIPENVVDFYTPLIVWLEELKAQLPESVLLTFEIEYINTSSTRAFIDVIKKVLSFKTKSQHVRIIWRYADGDDDNFDLGKDLEYSVRESFEFEKI